MTPAPLRLLALLLLGLVLAPVLGSPAAAEEPLDITGPVTDRAGVLSEEQTAVVETTLDDFYTDTRRQLFVVYVDSFEGMSGQDWADATATESGIGAADLLLAVAVRERAYGYSLPPDGFSDEEIETVDREHILPALRRSAWDDAAIAAAEGFTEASEGTDVPWGLVALAVAAVLGAGGYAVYRSRQRYDHTHHVVDEHGNPVDPAEILTDAELEQNAAAALVAVDDALHTSEQELGFAEAQFGPAATREFREALEAGRATMREAFTLRQQLDDAEPETDQERRQMASRIITLCEQVDVTLDEHVEAFDRMRDIEDRAPEALAEVAARRAAAGERLPHARETWARLQETRSTAALAPVADNVVQAEALLSAAEQAVSNGRQDVATDTDAAAVDIRAAEAATAQAEVLMAALETLEQDLAAATSAADDLAGRVATQVQSVQTFVETHRGAIGSHARTRLSEAGRLLETGRSAMSSEPSAATTPLTRAERLVREAQQAAEADVARWRADERRDAEHREGTTGLDSLLLGGILIDRDRQRGAFGDSTAYRGSTTRRRSGRSRARRTTRRAPSSFGGTSTRARRGGGGRF